MYNLQTQARYAFYCGKMASQDPLIMGNDASVFNVKSDIIG